MKKLVYLFTMILGFSLTGCEPMEDIHEAVDAELEARPTVGTAEFTLTEDDYDELGLQFGNFNSIEEANELLPQFLADRYPVWGKGSLATVGIDIYAPAVEVEDIVEYEVTSEDYEALGFRYGNFDSSDDMITFLEYKYPDAVEGDAVELTYKYYSGGSTSTRTTTFVFADDSWFPAVILERDDYNEMGESFPNFSNRDNAIDKISTFLELNNPYADEGDQLAVLYDLFSSGSTSTYVEVFTFDGDSWSAPGATLQTSLQFGHNGTGWEPDNTITYTLKAADFDLIGEALSEVYPDPAWSAGNYNNFDRRRGNQNYWSDEMLLEAMNILLEKIAPSAEEGQKYVLTFAIYDGSAGTESMSVIKEGGEWVLNE